MEKTKFLEFKEGLGNVEKGSYRYTLEIDKSILEILGVDFIDNVVDDLMYDKWDEIRYEINTKLKDKNLECGPTSGGKKFEGEDRLNWQYFTTMELMLEG